MSDSVWPHRRQPARLPRPWDSPGKNTGVGCHYLLQCMKGKVKSLSRVQLIVTPWTAVCPWDFPGKSTGVGCHCLHYLGGKLNRLNLHAVSLIGIGIIFILITGKLTIVVNLSIHLSHAILFRSFYIVFSNNTV